MGHVVYVTFVSKPVTLTRGLVLQWSLQFNWPCFWRQRKRCYCKHVFTKTWHPMCRLTHWNKFTSLKQNTFRYCIIFFRIQDYFIILLPCCFSVVVPIKCVQKFASILIKTDACIGLTAMPAGYKH